MSFMNENGPECGYLEQEFSRLPEKAQRAVCWVLENKSMADQFARGKKLTDRAIQDMARKALEKEDYLLLALVCYKKWKDENAGG